MNQYLVSPLVEQQLPSFVRDEYSNFTLFLQKYYEWMEQSQNAIYAANSLRNSQDVDLADEYYIELIREEFLPYFPAETLLDKRKFLKLVNQFYKAKGTPPAVQFLFRALFNEEITITYPKDQILIASDGKWVLPLALRIDTDDENIFNIAKCLLTGQTSKATAVVEQVTRSVDRQLGISYIEVFVSNIQKLFETGETVSATYNDGVTDITVSGRLIGALSEIKIDANNRGLFYNAYDTETGYAGDPVTIIGGLNPESNTPIGAIAYVGETTKGSITDIIVTDGGFGFRDLPTSPGSSIVDFVGGFEGATFGQESKAEISLIDDSVYRTMNVSTTTIETLLTVPISNVENNAISSISTYETFNVYPISFVTITGAGGGYRNKPSVNVYSLYMESFDDVLLPGTYAINAGATTITSASTDFTTYVEIGDLVRLFVNNKYEEVLQIVGLTSTTMTFDKAFPNTITGVSIYHILRSDLSQLGSLGRIEIVSGGDGYAAGEYLVFTGGTGYGANAIVSSVHAGNSGIKTVDFVQTANCVIGGEGYDKNNLPTVTVNTVAGANASLRVLEITGEGESLNIATSRIGAISKLRVVSYGYDYVSAPIISLRNADLTVANVTEGVVFVSNTKVYQGTSNSTTTFSAWVDKYVDSSGLLRVFNYKGTIDTTKPIISDDNTVTANVVSSLFYGDGRAKATATFENGLIRLPGLYLNTDGQVSADKVIQDGNKYHNYSYVINTTNDYSKFKTSMQNIVHPIGTKIFVNRIETVSNEVDIQQADYEMIETDIPVTFNISNGTHNLVSTNASINVASTVNVGDIVFVTNIVHPFANTISVNTSSNGITSLANNFNFVNEFADGDELIVYRGLTYEAQKDVTTQETNVTGLTFNPSGNTMYVVGTIGDDITYYALSTPWNVATSSVTTQKALGTTTAPTDIFFKSDGTKIWVTSTAPAVNICTFTLTEPWNVQTIAANTETYSLSSVTTSPTGIYWKPDGTKYFIVSSAGTQNDMVLEYTVSQTWNVSTSTLTNKRSVTTEETTPNGITFDSTGSKMFIVGSGSDNVAYYRLKEPWNIASSYFIRSISVTNPLGMYYSENQNKMYIISDTGSAAGTNMVTQYGTDFSETINTIDSVEDYYSLYMQNTFSYTSNSAYVDKIYTHTGTVTSVNANTILINTTFSTNSRFTSAIVQQVK